MKIRLMGAELFNADGGTHDEANSRFSQFCETRLKTPVYEICINGSGWQNSSSALQFS